jgi:hypothetical protein
VTRRNCIFALCLALALSACSRKSNRVGGPDAKPTGPAAAKAPPPIPEKKAAEPPSGLFPILSGGKWGYINREGKTIIEPQYLAAMRFFEGVALVRDPKSKLYGYIDKSGKYVIEPKYVGAGPFSEGLATIWTAPDKAGCIDMAGKIVIDPQFKQISQFSDGMAMVVYQRQVRPGIVATDSGFINMKGEWVIGPIFDMASRFNDGVASVRSLGQLFRVIDRSGNTILPPKYEDLGPFSEGLAPANGGGEHKYKWGYINREGKFAITPKFSRALMFSEGLAGVQADSRRWGYVNKTGKLVIMDRYDAVDQFVEGLARVVVNEKVGYIDTNGKYVWQPKS